MTTGACEVTRGVLKYEIHGKGETITFLHGFGMDHRLWQPQIEYFTQQFQVLTYDLRGFGTSSIPGSPYAHHDDLARLLEHLGINQTHLVGLSLGGEIAIDTTLTHPDLVKSLTLINSSLGGYASTVSWNVHAREEGIPNGKHYWLTHEVFNETRKHPEAYTHLQQMVKDYSGSHWIDGDMRKKLFPKAIDRIMEIAVPTLIMKGANDLSYFHDVARILERRIELSRTEEIEDSGHLINIEQPIIFNTMLVDFLDTL